MTIWGLGGGVGVVGGGAIGQMLHNRRRGWMPLFVGACVAAAAFPTWFLINADVGRLPLALSFAAGFLGGALASPPGPNARCLTPSPTAGLVPRQSTSSFPALLLALPSMMTYAWQCAGTDQHATLPILTGKRRYLVLLHLYWMA